MASISKPKVEDFPEGYSADPISPPGPFKRSDSAVKGLLSMSPKKGVTTNSPPSFGSRSSLSGSKGSLARKSSRRILSSGSSRNVVGGGKREAIKQAIIGKPKASRIENNSYVHAVMKWYNKVVVAVCNEIKKEREGILFKSMPTVDIKDEIKINVFQEAKVGSGGGGGSGAKRRKDSTCNINALPSLATYLNESFLKCLLGVSEYVFQTICRYSSVDDEVEDLKWDRFNKCCIIAVQVPKKIVEGILGVDNMLVGEALGRGIDEKWRMGMEKIVGQESVVISMRVCRKLRENTGGFQMGDEEGDDDEVWLEAKELPEVLVVRATGVVNVINEFNGMISLCRGEEEDEDEDVIEEPEDSDASDEEQQRRMARRASSYIPRRRGIMYVWLCTIWNELKGFLELLKAVKSNQALLAVEQIRRCMNDLLGTIYVNKSGWAEGWNDGIMVSIGAGIKEAEVGLARGLCMGYLRTCNTIVLPGVGGVSWSEERNHMGATRVSSGVAGWVGFACEVANDCRIFGRGGVICKEVFARVLKESIKGLRIRYVHANPSRVMLQQWKVDIVVLLKFASWFSDVLLGSLSKIEEEEDDFWKIDDDDDVNGENGAPKLARPDDADCIRNILQCVKDVENDCSMLIWMLALLGGDGKDVLAYVKVAAQPIDSLTPKTYDRRKSSLLEIVNSNFTKLLESPMLWAMFAPQKLMQKEDPNSINVLKINGILCGGLDEKNIFNKIKTLKLPWTDILDSMGNKLGSGAGVDGAQLSPGEILKWTRKRHELGEWSFPKLTQEEEDIKSKLVDFLNSRT